MRFKEILAKALGFLAGTLAGIFLRIKGRLSRYPKPISECTNISASFSPVSYLERIDKLCEELWQEPCEKYVIVLWWGLDGIRLNKDGTTKWIRRETKQYPTYLNFTRSMYEFSTFGSCCCQNAIWTAAQNQAIINSIDKLKMHKFLRSGGL